MIQRFEQTVRSAPHDVFFQYVDVRGEAHSYSYEETRFLAAGLALLLRNRGVSRGSAVAIDMPNCPEFVMIALAAAYGGFALVVLNNRLSAAEKESRLAEAWAAGLLVNLALSKYDVSSLLGRVPAGYDDAYRDELSMSTPARASARSKLSERATRRTRLFGRGDRPDRTGGIAEARISSREVINFAERARAGFDASARALVMFTSGTTGRPKATVLTWENLIGSARAANAVLGRRHEGLWQAALPMFHIGGFQILVRSILGETPFILYRSFDAHRVLADARTFGATHLSVVDKMLQDLVAADDGTLSAYRCVLLGGAALNPATVRRAYAAKAHVFASYGMTETASLIAVCEVDASFDGGLALLPGYDVRIVTPNASGTGQLAVRGPGVFAGYLNARVPRTADGFFLTGDSASVVQGRLYLRERTEDMFVSGGENVYPSEIQRAIMELPRVSDACVIGVKDETWGRRPVAFVECAHAARETDGRRRARVLVRTAARVRDDLESELSKLNRPKHVFALDSFPRTGVGKVDRGVLEGLYAERIEVKRVTLYRIEQPFLHPHHTAKTVMNTRESVIVEVEDWQGRTGLGECVAFPTAWYLPETLDEDLRVIERYLIPIVLSEAFLHPGEVSLRFGECAEAAAFPLAQAAVEPALWDLYGKIVGRPLWQLIGGASAAGSVSEKAVSPTQARVKAGAVLGIMPLDSTLAETARLVDQGCGRIKLKIRPGDDYARVRAVREAVPQVDIMLDANQSYTERDLPVLRALDKLGVRCIEEPLNPHINPTGRSKDLFSRLASLQRELETRVCLDESVVTPTDLERALAHPELSCYAVKIGKLGGIGPALDFCRRAQRVGIEVWVGGMYDTSISKRAHAAFETLPGIDIPGDISGSDRYFGRDIAVPALVVEHGEVVLNPPGFEAGIGCALDRAALSQVLVARRDFHA